MSAKINISVRLHNNTIYATEYYSIITITTTDFEMKPVVIEYKQNHTDYTFSRSTGDGFSSTIIDSINPAIAYFLLEIVIDVSDNEIFLKFLYSALKK